VKNQWIQISHLIGCYDMFSIIQILLNSQISSSVGCVSSALSQLQLIFLVVGFFVNLWKKNVKKNLGKTWFSVNKFYNYKKWCAFQCKSWFFHEKFATFSRLKKLIFKKETLIARNFPFFLFYSFFVLVWISHYFTSSIQK
jgi:hypothetical protein